MIAEVLTRIAVGFFIFWLIGGFAFAFWILEKWDRDTDE